MFTKYTAITELKKNLKQIINACIGRLKSNALIKNCHFSR